MIEEVATLVECYRSWLKDKTALREINGHIEITTPFLDRHNDFIQIYARRENDGFLLTDDGYTIDDLSMSGCSLDTPKRKDFLRSTLSGFGVKNENGELCVHATKDSFPLKKHSLIQSVLAVNDLFYLATPHVANVFLEDVILWLDSIDVRYTPNVKFTGTSGYDHLFDFAIPKSKQEPERLLRAINDPTKNTAQTVAFSWLDTRHVRSAASIFIAILNDSNRRIPPNVDQALQSYDVKPVHWSRREEVQDQLAA